MIGLGYGGLRPGAVLDPGPSWSMTRGMLTPRATTRWDELATARASGMSEAGGRSVQDRLTSGS
ncbi:DUF4113 domain-containing protein [Leucobacter massiliensis]|uniref:DUF4113 domain-containing protein n=1 Tax=Leucobacter massiliensis TaxID=1686285 RepID=A0A2S9QN76_9MICO|nr:DUF4113 domain-containing protein [Leucobacter massiliensis]PRI11044.1 hypothetical protein B4915_09260 [Leucobacter massiliensis]